ncbi:unnamed protein product [Gadus morhua 'NCC']
MAQPENITFRNPSLNITTSWQSSPAVAPELILFCVSNAKPQLYEAPGSSGAVNHRLCTTRRILSAAGVGPARESPSPRCAAALEGCGVQQSALGEGSWCFNTFWESHVRTPTLASKFGPALIDFQ